MGGIIMNENIDLTKILDGCPAGTEFYHVVFGKVAFKGVSEGEFPIQLEPIDRYRQIFLTKDGKLWSMYNGECTLFPSKDQRDWSKFVRFWDKPKVEKFDPMALQPFDKILVRDEADFIWKCNFFAYINITKQYKVICVDLAYKTCIPYNDETKHLLGTASDCPEYYKWWEE